MDKPYFEFDGKPTVVTTKIDPDSQLKEYHDNSAFRVFLVFITWLLQLLSRDGIGFFIAMAVLCVPLIRDYYMDMRNSFSRSIQNPSRRLRIFKYYRLFTSVILAFIALIPLAGLFGIISVGFDYHGNAYAYITNNIFFNSNITVSLSVFLFGTLPMPFFALIDWLCVHKIRYV